MTELARRIEPVSDPAGRLAAAFVTEKTKLNANTGAAYRVDLASWLDWCAAAEVDPLQAWSHHVVSWHGELGERGEAGTTRARRLGAVSAWYRWLLRHQAGGVQRNPAAQLDRGERPTRNPRGAPALSREHTEALLAEADAQATRTRRGRPDRGRAAAIVALLVYTGVRVSELCAARVCDVGIESGSTVLHVRAGKGGKRRVRPLPAPAFERLDRYQRQRPDQPAGTVALAGQAGAGQDRPLIATATGRHLTRAEVRRLLKRLAADAGLPAALVDTISPHSTRTTFITDALDEGAPLDEVADAAGHAGVATTRGYDRRRRSLERDPAWRVAGRYRVASADQGTAMVAEQPPAE